MVDLMLESLLWMNLTKRLPYYNTARSTRPTSTSPNAGEDDSSPVADTVVLVHGLWMGSWVMSIMAMRLRRCGFRTALFSYPSMSNSLSENAAVLARFVAGLAVPRIHFIGHSLGGVYPGG